MFNEFKKCNDTGARMLDSLDHMTLNVIKNRILGRENVRILSSISQRNNGHHYVTLRNIYKPLVVNRFYYMA